jgi:hypothetical protein
MRISSSKSFGYIFTQMEQNVKQELIDDNKSLNKDSLSYLFIIDGLDEWHNRHINKKNMFSWTCKDTQASRDEIKAMEFESNNLEKTFYKEFMAFVCDSKFSIYNFVYIFNTNNNNTVFGNAAINNRIMKCNFDLANKSDAIIYLQHFLGNYNYSMIRCDIKISYRDLYCIMIHFGGKNDNIINFINNVQDTFDFNIDIDTNENLVDNILRRNKHVTDITKKVVTDDNIFNSVVSSVSRYCTDILATINFVNNYAN